MLFESLWARTSHHDLHAVASPPIHARTSISKKFHHSKKDVTLNPMPMRKGLFVMGVSMFVYSGAFAKSIDFYRLLSFIRCMRHAKRVDSAIYAQTDFADFQATLGYFAKVSVAVYLRVRPWCAIQGLKNIDDVAAHFLAISRLQGEQQRKAHGILHRACKDVHAAVKDFNDEGEELCRNAQRWESEAGRMVGMLVDVIGDRLLGEMIHGSRATTMSDLSTAASYPTVSEDYFYAAN